MTITAPEVDPRLTEALAKIQEFEDEKFVQDLLAPQVAKIPANVRNGLYVGGIVAGSLGTAASAIALALTGDAALIVATVAAVLLGGTAILAKLHIGR